MAADVKQILRAYGLRLQKNSRLSDLYRNAKDYADAMAYAKGSGDELAQTISALADLANMSEDELIQLLDTCLKANHGNVTSVCLRAQGAVNRRARLNIGALTADYSPEAARVMATKLISSQDPTYEHLRNLVIKETMGTVDRTISMNAEAQNEMGLTCRIVRRYDDVGLHDGKDPCQWCLAREGEWNTYQDAMDAGAFERHDGCGCVITYEVGRTRTWSNWKGKWENLDDL